MSKSTYEKIERSDFRDDVSRSDDEVDVAPVSRALDDEDTALDDQRSTTVDVEEEKLLKDEKYGKRKRRRRSEGSSRRRKKELMYEVEEGGRRSSGESSEDASEADMQRLKESQARHDKTSRLAGYSRLAGIHVVIVAAFLALLYGAYKASPLRKSTGMSSNAGIARTLSNGTHTFAPTTLLISLDGFRADFLTRNLTPVLNSFVRSGVSPKYMLPAFPSLTFPNHFTLVTGLHPESHGVVGNTFWDPVTKKEFYYTDPARSMQPEWWNAEPLWLTAELAGVKSAIHMWPGSEAHIGSMEPAHVDEFNGDEQLNRKVDRILSWIDLPGPEDIGAKADMPRPQFIAAYVPNVDADGHKFGPNSTYIRSTIKEVDGMLGSLFRGLADRNLTDIINIIVVSDHGMATTSINRLIQLEDLIDPSLIEHTDGWPLYGLRPFDSSPSNLQNLYTNLKTKSNLPAYRGKFSIYLRDTNMPPRYHFTASPRIAPLWLIPTTGYAIVTAADLNVSLALSHKGKQPYHPRGLHGYDFEDPLMRAIFIAQGPAFPHPGASEMEVFQNVEVYNIVCDSLGIEPRRNNGTLRLPLRTKGVHDFDQPGEEVVDLEGDGDGDGKKGGELEEVPNLAERPGTDFDFDLEDLGEVVNPAMPATDVVAELGPVVSAATRTQTKAQKATGTKGGHDPVPTRPVVHDGLDGDEEDESTQFNRWWEWLKGKLDGVRWWGGGDGDSKVNNATASGVEG